MEADPDRHHGKLCSPGCTSPAHSWKACWARRTGVEHRLRPDRLHRRCRVQRPAHDLLDCNYVSSVSFTEDTTELFDNLIVSLNYVVVLIIVCAAALAAVVLYNLISVNLGERKKELATIKVLGFYDKEVYRYIFREIELLALIGSGVGLLLGVPLHQFIMLTVEMDQLMFIRTIAPRSYLLAWR